jgi:hypothetical protein
MEITAGIVVDLAILTVICMGTVMAYLMRIPPDDGALICPRVEYDEERVLQRERIHREG